MKRFHNQSILVIIIVVCLSAVILSTISINSAYQLDNNLVIQKKHPFTVSEAIYKIRGYAVESEIRINRLVMYNVQADVTIVRNALERLQMAMEEELQVVLARYLGSHKDAEFLEELCHELKQKEFTILEQVSNMSDSEIEEYIKKELTPYYGNIQIVTERILNFAKDTTDSLIKKSSAVLFKTVFFSALFTVLVLLICLLLFKEYNQKVKERSLREFLFEFLAKNIDNVFMIYNVEQSDMEYVFSNAERVLGLSHEELLANPSLFFDYWTKESKQDQESDSSEDTQIEEKEQLKKQFIQNEIIQRIDREVLYVNPKTKLSSWISFSIQPVIGENNETRYIISATDLTEIKKTQQVLHDALVNAQNASKAKSEFLSRMSHEIRTPMNAIIGMTTIAASSVSDKNKLEDCLTKIAGASKHLLLLINDILDMSKIESGKMSVLKEPFSIVELLKNITSIIYSQANSKKLDFNVIIQSLNYETLTGDSLRLNQVLLNILSNAVKYTEKGGNIKLTVQEVIHKRSNTVSLRFTVKDTGKGMSPEFMKKLFTPFEQEDRNSNSRTGSTGIGLAITKNIVTLMNGTITIDSTLGTGTTVVVELPFETEESRAKKYAYNIEFDNLKVLIADDDQDTCEHVTLLLKRMKIEAEWVLLAEEAVEKAIHAFEDGDSYDVLFLDWRMNDIDGIEATRRIRKKVGPDVLIIIISAYDWTEIESEARLAGANAFISKPMLESTIYNTLITNVKKNIDEVIPPSVNVKLDLSGKRFLVAEDNDINMEIAVALLESMGATVEGAFDGQEAYEKFVSSPIGYYHMILMDVQMPKMDGYETTRAIRKSEHLDNERIPIVAMTANAFSEDVFYALESGMNAHVSKPIEINVFYDTIQKYLEKMKIVSD